MAAGVKVTALGGASAPTLPAVVFAEPFHESAIHEVARADLAARRRGTASTLTRGEVAMTGAKAWRQKGTGRARIGAHSVPHRRGGGVAFGPKPRRYTVKVNRKLQRRAFASALSVHGARESIAIFDGSGFEAPSTKQAAALLAEWGGKGTALVILGSDQIAAAKSFRNLPKVRVLPAAAVAVADLIGAASLLLSEQAIEVLVGRGSAEVGRGARRAAAEPEAAGGET